MICSCLAAFGSLGMAAKVDSTGGVYFVPTFNGVFAPSWRDDARGVLIGITQFTISLNSMLVFLRYA